jgi:predicted nucleotidyltransferase
MKSVMKPGIWKIMNIFYTGRNKGEGIHLREIARRAKLNENSTSRFLKQLEDEGILKSKKEGNLKKYTPTKTTKTCQIYSIFDNEKYEKLPYKRKEAIKKFLEKIEEPLIILLFGSTAKENYKQESDIDLLLINNNKIKTKEAEEYAESQTGIKINPLQITQENLINEIALKKDPLIQSAITTGYPITNQIKYYQLILGVNTTL